MHVATGTIQVDGRVPNPGLGLARWESVLAHLVAIHNAEIRALEATLEAAGVSTFRFNVGVQSASEPALPPFTIGQMGSETEARTP